MDPSRPGPSQGDAPPPSPPLPSPAPAPEAGEPGGPAAAPFRKSGLAFFAVLLLLYGPGILAQQLHPAAGLAWSELFVFLLPAFAAALGSNLRAVPYLGLARPAGVPLALAALAGAAGFLVANALMFAWVEVLPPRVTELFDVGRLFETPGPQRYAIAAAAALLAPVCEEVAFRGYLQRTVALRRGPAAGLAAGTIFFALLHLDPVRLPALLLQGLLFGWLALRSGNTWNAVAAHAMNNALAAGAALASAGSGADEAAGAPATGQMVATLVAGGVALALLLRAFRNATPPPPPAAAALERRDPAQPSLRFRLARLPQGVWASASLGMALLAALALVAALGGGRTPAPPVPPGPAPTVPAP
ncbi:Abortive infection protein [Anaeromyxobacter dehalogenans 2CP-1]|uniref:Abortive infection protein n=1 Tax=Anaeromyxobacter dehalogenans (strain ATCC BAA-258 / DSM 21875 / 2CP-1) TaxID=455488 RepID=B8J575_ANAD2|nr:CPBP family intramembrane glutamic endopeptidase [Anaeromyxobacter dehalogenans]ACL64930.1 Abortive infection protein [Anaeromyxobacter dehalogenans 2CP-1]